MHHDPFMSYYISVCLGANNWDKFLFGKSSIMKLPDDDDDDDVLTSKVVALSTTSCAVWRRYNPSIVYKNFHSLLSGFCWLLLIQNFLVNDWNHRSSPFSWSFVQNSPMGYRCKWRADQWMQSITLVQTRVHFSQSTRFFFFWGIEYSIPLDLSTSEIYA